MSTFNVPPPAAWLAACARRRGRGAPTPPARNAPAVSWKKSRRFMGEVYTQLVLTAIHVLVVMCARSASKVRHENFSSVASHDCDSLVPDRSSWERSE